MSNVKIRQYLEGDETGLVELLEVAFNGWPKFDLPLGPLEYWRWKFLDQPVKVFEIGVAEDEGRIVGCNHAIWFWSSFGGVKCLTRQGLDLAVHPDYRGQGIYPRINLLREKIRDEAKAQLGYWGVSHPRLVARSERQGRPRLPHTMSTMARILDIDLHLEKEPTNRALLKKYGYLFASAINSLKAREVVPVKNGVKLSDVKEFGPGFDGFFEEARKGYLWIMWKDREYLNWRYGDPRGGAFRAVKAVGGDGGILGYIVSRVDHSTDYPQGYIVDWLTAPGRLDVLPLLLRNVLEEFDEQGVNITVALTVKASSDYRVFMDTGFVDSRQENFLFYHIYDESPHIMETNRRVRSSEPDQFHFTYGDTDWI